MADSASPSIPRVALLIETTRSYTRDILAGIRRYLAAHGPWSCFLELRSLESAPPPWLASWKGDGILTRTSNQEMADVILATGVPAVELRSTDLDHPFPFVGMDNALIGRTVADHFLGRGYREFGVYTLDHESFFRERNENFRSAVLAAGCDCATLSTSEEATHLDWEGEQQRLMRWLVELPKPVGLFATNDSLGVQVLEACLRAGLRVPEEVAVVGTENEETLCSFAKPALTSIAFDGETVGFRSASLLAEIMAGRGSPPATNLVAPRGIVLRQSSDEMVIGDRLVVRALQILRQEALLGLTTQELSHRLGVSRSTLERRMKDSLGRTPKAEMQRLRFREAERLLRDTSLTIEAVSERCGFTHPHYFHAAFRQRYGKTPDQFRRSFAPTR